MHNMSAISDYNEACISGHDSMGSGLYADALRSFEQAWAAQLRIPDSEFDREKLTFPRESINEMIKYCKKRAIESGQLVTAGKVNSIQYSEVEYRRG